MSLKKLVLDELIDRNVAFSVAPNQDALKMALTAHRYWTYARAWLHGRMTAGDDPD